MSWLVRLKKLFERRRRDEDSSPEAVDHSHDSPFASLIETSGETTPDLNANVKDVFVIADASPSEPDTIGIVDPNSMRIRVRDPQSGELSACYQWQGPAIEEYIPIWGDWVGDGVKAFGLYHPSSGYYNLFSGLDCNELLYRVSLGKSGSEWHPLTGDWNGDGKDGIGLYHAESGTFLLSNRLEDTHAPVEYSFVNENHRSGDIGLSGDWNGDGTDELGVYNPSSGVFILFDDLTSGHRFDEHTAHNVSPDWIPLSGDWRGIGMDSIGLYDKEGSVFYLMNPADDRDPEIVVPINKEPGGWIPFSLNNYKSAAGNLQEGERTTVAENSDVDEALFHELKVLNGKSDFSKALEGCNQALKRNPRCTPLLAIMGKSAFQLKLYDLAEISFQSILQRDANNIESIIGLGKLAEKQRKWDKALVCWDRCLPKLKDRNTKFNALVAKGKALLNLGSYDKTEKVYLSLAKNFPGQLEGWIGLFRIARKRNDWKAAKQHLQDCINRFPNHRLMWDWKLQLADMMLHMNEYENAAAIYSAIPFEHSGRVQALESLAKIEVAQEKWNQAIDWYQQCSLSFPRHNKSIHWRLKAAELMVKTNKLREAEDLYKELSSLVPGNTQAESGLRKVRAMMSTTG